MVSTCPKAITRGKVATQTELPHKHTAVQVPGYRECLSLSLVPEGSRHNSYFWCDQVNDLLSLVAELKEEVERLRSIRECEREIDWWSRSLPSLRPRHQIVFWFGLDKCNVPAKTAPSLPLLNWTEERKYDERLEGQDKDRERSLTNYCHGQTRLNLGRKGSLTHHQSNQSRIVRKKSRS